MQILAIQRTNNKFTKPVAFKQRHHNTLPRDTFKSDSDNIAGIKKNKYNRLERIKFKRPLSVQNAFLSLSKTYDDYIIKELQRRFQVQDTFELIALQLNNYPEIANIKVKSLVGFGAFAMAFETVDGNILKITDINHFPNGRKPDDFDLPIKKHGKFGDYYYYIEEKVSQEDLTQKELKALVKHIKSKGYTMRDYLVHYDEENPDAAIKEDQFGRAKNGKIYLIDPGCAIAPPKHFFDVKRIKDKIKEKIFDKFNKKGD